MNDFKPATAAIITFLFVIAVAITAIYDVQPPSPLPATAPDSLFSADRAAGYIREIARQPHPLGSAANARVREFIVRQLNEIGVRPQLDTVTVTGAYSGIHYAASVVNIVARIPGTHDTKAVLLMAHYDSVPTGPGASDDGSGVATILETLRALKASHPLKNTVIAVFTDGEEVGMMGGQAVAQNKILMKETGVVLNFEARGTDGPSLMFETSPDNGWLIRQLAKYAPDPVATSLSYDVYKHLPNNTDFSWLKAKGIEGMNFAFIGDLQHYHSEMDNYSNIDEASIQHDGSYALAVTKGLGDIALPGPKSESDVYFNFFYPSFVRYPADLGIPITILSAFILALTFYVGIKRRTIKLVKTLVGTAIPILPLLVFGGGTYFLWKFLQHIYPESSHFLFGAFYYDGIFLCAVIALALALTTALYVFLRKYFRSSEMAVGALFWWLVLAAIAGYYIPYGAYLFQWPLLFSSLALLIFFVTAKSDFRSPIMMFIFLVFAVPGIYMTVQTSYLIYLIGLLPAVAAGIVALSVLGLTTILPHLAIMTAPKKWLLSPALLAAALVIGTGAVLSHQLDSHHPKTDSIDYALDSNDSSAYWISFDDSTDEWTSQFMNNPVDIDSIPDFFPSWWMTPHMAAKAAPVSIQPASVTMTGDSTFRGAQFMQLLVKPAPRTRSITFVADADAQVLSAAVNGVPVEDSSAIFPTGKRHRWVLRYYGIPDSGSTLTLMLPVGQRFRLTATEVVSGLPEAGGLPTSPRPSSIMQRPFVTTDASVVLKSYTF